MNFWNTSSWSRMQWRLTNGDHEPSPNKDMVPPCQFSIMTTRPIDQVDDIFTVIYDKVYGQIEYLVRNKSLDFSNVDDLFRATMEAVDYVSNEGRYLSGTQKGAIAKQVIISILEDLIKDKKLEKELGRNIILAVDFLGPAVFKLITLASKGMINLIHGSSAAPDGTPQPPGVAKKGCCSVV